jgi:uncharacterized protein
LRRSSPNSRASILIVAISGRGLARAAQRAGYVPLVLDFFCDSDTEEIAHDCRKFAGPIKLGIQAEALMGELSQLATAAPSPVLGCLAGAGFEDRPELLSEIAARWALLGNERETVARIKSMEFFNTLDRLHIPHPPTQLEPPEEDGWLVKSRGGAGGSHVADFAVGQKLRAAAYYQRKVTGPSVSALFVANGNNARVLGFSEQWTAPTSTSPYRYGGAARPAAVPTRAETDMVEAVTEVAQAFELKGLGSADFIVEASTGVPLLLELNPRPGATLDIFDSEEEPLLGLHVGAVLEGKLPGRPLSLERASASAIVFAPETMTVAQNTEWPNWVADRPKPGECIDKDRPICTVLAGAGTKAQAMELVTERTQLILAGLRPKNRGETG